MTRPNLVGTSPGDPHIGHAYEAITSDVLSRYQRMAGKRVFFQTGSDEHGQKIANRAEALGLQPIDICDKYAGKLFYLGVYIQIILHLHIYHTTRINLCFFFLM